MKNNITYILTHHSENSLRDKNLHAVLSWIKSLKGNKEIILVEQGKVSTIKTFSDVKYVFAFNDNLFSKAWGMNIGTQYASNEYLVYVDSDCLCHKIDMESFTEKFIKDNYEVGSPNKYKYHYLSPKESDYIRENAINFKLIKEDQINNIVSFAGGMFMVKKSIMNEIKLWDEDFIGWGFEDLAVEAKLNKITDKVLRCEYATFHLDHGNKTNSYFLGKDKNHKLLMTRYTKDNLWIPHIKNINISELGNEDKLKTK
tara:strand:- start:1587 stop:2357 length:771 start_codon:yes stop_codon:yes gene_type:complete